MEPPSWQAGSGRLPKIFWLFLLITIGYMIWVRSYLVPLTSHEIIQLEVAKTVDKAKAIIADWKISGKYEQGVKSIYIAYVFMVIYTVTIALGCRFISACTGNEILMKGGRGFAGLIFLATICDLVENIALSQTIRGNISRLNVTLAYNLARVKFSIVIVCLLFIFSCFLYWGVAKLSREKN